MSGLGAGTGFPHRRWHPLQPFKDCTSGVVGSWAGAGAGERDLSWSWVGDRLAFRSPEPAAAKRRTFDGDND